MGFNDKRAGSANPQSRGSVFDPELAAATTLDAVGSVFEGDSHTRGPAGPTGPQGDMGLSVNRLTTTPDPDNRTTTLNFYVGVIGNDQLIPVPVVVPWGQDGSAEFSSTVNVITGEPGTQASASVSGTGTADDMYVLSLTIPRGADGAHVASASVTGGTLTLTLSDGNEVVVTGDVRGEQGETGAIFVPIYFTRNETGSPAITNVSLTEDEVHTNVTVYRSDNPLRILLFGGPNNVYDPDNPSLDANAFQTIQNGLSSGTLGTHTLGATGPMGEDGNEVAVFYADDATGTNASTIRGANQYFIQFVLHERDQTPVAPTSGYFNIRGEQGQSEDIAVFWADDNDGTNASQTRRDNQYFVRFVIFTQGTSPATPSGGFVNIRGLQGERGPEGFSVANVYFTLTQVQGGGSTFSNPSTILQTGHNYFIAARTDDITIFPDGFDRESTDNQFTRDAGYLESIINSNAYIVSHELGATGARGETGLQGPVGPRGNSIGSVTITEDSVTTAGGVYDVSVGIVDNNGDPVSTLDAGSFTAPRGPSGDGFNRYDTVDDLPDDGTNIQIALVNANNELYRWDASLDTPAWVILDDGGSDYSDDQARAAVNARIVDGNLEIQDSDNQTVTFSGGSGIMQVATTADLPTTGQADIRLVLVQAANELYRWDTSLDTPAWVIIDDVDRPIRDWVSGTDYAIGDQVLYGVTSGDLRNAFSVYIRVELTQEQIDAGLVFDNTVAPEVSGTSVGWRLMRSGIVRLQTDGNDGSTGATDTGAGITSNSTLRIHQGDGITITRDATTFTITQRGTHHSSDVDDFGPGYAYSYFNLRDETVHTGTVGPIGDSGFEFSRVDLTTDGFPNLVISFVNAGDRISDGDNFAFVTSQGAADALFEGDPDDPATRRIVYANLLSATTARVLAVDPPVHSRQELVTLFNATSPPGRTINLPVHDLFTLNEHHVTPASGTAQWALTDDPTAIPGNKFEELSEDPPTSWADGTPFSTIDTDWLPTLGGATDSAAGTAGIVPAPAAGDQNDFLRGDGTWVAVSSGGTGRIVFTERDGNTFDATGFITDLESPDAVATIRSAEFSDSLLRFNLATFSSTTALTATTTLNWDAPAGDFRATATLDNLVQDTWVANVTGTVTGGTGSASFNDFARSQTLPLTTRAALNTTFDVTTANPIYDRGTNGATVSANFILNDGTTTFGDPRTISYAWSTPNSFFNITNPSTVSFLSTISSASYSISVSGLSTPNVAGHVLTPTGGSVSSTNPSGNASGTFTFTNPAHKDNTGTTRSVSVATTFTRPAGVQSSAGGETRNATRSDSPAFSFAYPVFYVLIAGATAPTRADLIDGNTFANNVVVLPGATSNGSASSFGTRQINNSGGTASTLWVGFRSSITQPTTFASGTQTFQGDITPTPSGQTIALAPDTVPSGYTAENYTMYPIAINAGASPFIRIG